MSDAQIDLLKEAVKFKSVYWIPDSETAWKVTAVSAHAEEGDDEPCAILPLGKYVALYNAEFRDFKAVTNL